MNVERTVHKDDGKIWAETKTVSVNEGLENIKTIKEELTLDKVKQYLKDGEEQMSNYLAQENKLKKTLKGIKARVAAYARKRAYITYKKNSPLYETFEMIAKHDMRKLINNTHLKEFDNFIKTKKNYTDYYITLMEEAKIDEITDALTKYNDIRQENDMFVSQMTQAKKYLTKELKVKK